MRSILAGLRTLVLPWGAKPGQPRIVLDGDSDVIQVFDASDNLVAQLDPNGLALGAPVGSSTSSQISLGFTGTGVPALLIDLAKQFLTPHETWQPAMVDPFEVTTGIDGQVALEILSPVGSSPFAQTYSANAAKLYLKGASLSGGQPASVRLAAGLLELANVTNATVSLQIVPGGAGITGVSALSAIVGGSVETWHLAAPSSGWGGTLKYRLVPSPANVAHVHVALSGGTTTDGTVVGNLPAGYRPAALLHFPIATSVNGARTAQLRLDTTGDLSILGIGAGGDLAGECFFPLDA